jgi:hypothetical protein
LPAGFGAPCSSHSWPCSGWGSGTHVWPLLPCEQSAPGLVAGGSASATAETPRVNDPASSSVAMSFLMHPPRSWCPA